MTQAQRHSRMFKLSGVEKQMNGEFEHYFWNIERLTSVAEKPIGAGAVPSGDEGREEFERLGSAGQGGPGPGPWRGHQPGRGPVQGHVIAWTRSSEETLR